MTEASVLNHSLKHNVFWFSYVCAALLCSRVFKIKRNDCGCWCWCCWLWRGITRTLRLCLSENVLHFQNSELDPPPNSSLYIMYSIYASVGCRDSGSLGFLISPSVSHLFEALSEGQNHIHPNEKAIVDLFLHLVPPHSFSPRKHLSFFVLLEAYETIRVHLCPKENSPALSKAVLFSTRPWQSMFLKAFGRL